MRLVDLPADTSDAPPRAAHGMAVVDRAGRTLLPDAGFAPPPSP